MNDAPWVIGYARVSAAKQAVEGDSLELQDALISTDVATQGWTLVPNGTVLREPFTGTTDDRPIYKSAIRFIRSHPGSVRYFVIRAIDRFTREGARAYQEMKEELAALGVELRDISRVIQAPVNSLEHTGFKYKWSVRSPSALSEVVLAEVAREEVATILTRLIGAEIKLVADGYHIGPANDGYVARRIPVGGKKRYAQFPDPERAHFFRKMFEMRAEGTHSDAEIVQALTILGFETRPRNRWNGDRTAIIGRRPGRPLSVKQLQSVIHDPVYCGVLCKKWTGRKPIRARGGEAIVSIDLYNKANRGKRFIVEHDDGSLTMLYDHKPTHVKAKRHRFRHAFRYKNVVACPVCLKPLLASASRGRSGRHFGAYHCTREHRRYAIAQDTLERVYDAFLSRLEPRSGTWDRIERVLAATFDAAEQEIEAHDQRLAEQISRLTERKEQLAEAFAQATLPEMRTEIERKLAMVADELRTASGPLPSRDAESGDLTAFLQFAKTLVEHPREIVANVENLAEQLTLYGLIFERIPTYPEIVNGTAPLTNVFKGIHEINEAQSSSVHRRGLGWNLNGDGLNAIVTQWARAMPVLQRVIRRYESRSQPMNAA